MVFSSTEQASENLASLSSIYEPLPGIYDEMLGLDGSPGPAWQIVADWLTRTSAESQSTNAKKIEQLVYKNFYDPQRGQLSWSLDNIPLMMDRETWTHLKTAAIQRATLYNKLLEDLYGEQTTFAQKLIPSTLIHADQSYLRPLHGDGLKGPSLTFLALDFARDPSGNWRVIDAHTETSAGHGFALANRMVISDVAGRLFRRTNAARIGPFYRALLDHLYERSEADDPLVVVLAPGVEQPSFAGHAFMARYMNFLSVRGSDLRVVGNRVYLKTIEGLQNIDLIVRAIEGHRADPLELSSDSFDGPVGLVEASRQNPGIMVNSLGTAVVENRGLAGYSNQLCNFFLGEDLVVPDAPRLWLGDPAVKQDVLSEIDEYVFRSAQEGTGSPGDAAPGRSTQTMNDVERADLEAEIQFSGDALVAEKPLGYATAPSWTPAGLKPEFYALRLYLSAIGDKFEVMPGGLALSIDDGKSVALSSPRAHSRDVWVVAETAQKAHISLKRLAKDGLEVQRQAIPLQSSIADNLFWLGRYVERADGMLRVIRQTLHHSADDFGEVSFDEQALWVLSATLDPEGTKDLQGLEKNGADGQALWNELRKICSDTSQGNALPQTFKRIQDIAVQCRSQLSEDGWRVLSTLNTEALSQYFSNPIPVLDDLSDNTSSIAFDMIRSTDELIIALSAFSGMLNDNMTRNAGWQFVTLGRHIERCYQLAALLNALFVSHTPKASHGDELIFALKAADSYMTFRSRYRFAPEIPLVLDLLMIDETNPRALAYQLAQLSQLISELPKSSDDAVRAPEQRMALDLLTKTRLAEVSELAKPSENGKRETLGQLLRELLTDLPELSKLLSRQYFSLADEQPRRL